MAGVWKRDGTVTVTTSSKKVVGVGTTFADPKNGVAKGHIFTQISGSAVDLYEVDYVVSNTELYLVQAFRGTTASGAAYAIITTFSDSIPEFSRKLTATLASYQEQSDVLQLLYTSDAAEITVTAPDGTAHKLIPWKRVTSDGEGQAARAKAEADRARAEADKATQAVIDSAVPFPDVWIPFNDSLRMFAGYGRDVKVGDDVVARMVNFERSTTATYIDKTGVLRTAAINEPRFEKQGLLIEGQSTNLVVNSRNPPPASSAVNITKVTSPLGDVFKFSAATTNNSVKEVKFATLTAGQSVTVSFIAEKGEIDTVAVGFDGMFAVTFNLTSASIEGLMPSGSSATITPIVGSSFYKVSVTTTTTGTVTPVLRLKTNGAYTANAIGEGMLIGNMQQELLPFASSYIPTNGAAVTRAADVLLLDGINMPIGPKTVAVNFTCTVNEGAQHGMTIFRENVYAVSDRQTLSITPAGVLGINEGGGTIDAIGMVISKATQVAVAVFNGPSSKLALNGIVSKAQRVPITANNQVYQQTWRIGDNTSYSSPIYGHIRNLRIWHRPLSDTQIKGVK